MKSLPGKITYHAVYDESIIDALAVARANGFAGIQASEAVGNTTTGRALLQSQVWRRIGHGRRVASQRVRWMV